MGLEKDNGTFEQHIYHKPTHINRYLYKDANHHPAQKCGFSNISQIAPHVFAKQITCQRNERM